MTHPPHGHRYQCAKSGTFVYTEATQPHVALGAIAATARALNLVVPTRITQITPSYYEDVKRIPMSGQAGRTIHYD